MHGCSFNRSSVGACPYSVAHCCASLTQHPHSWGGTRSLVDGEHRADLGFRSDGHTSNCRYDQPRSPSPAIFVEEHPSSAGPEKEGWRCVEEQKQCRRRSACIVDGGKEKEVEEMREALKVGLPRVDGRPNSRARIVCLSVVVCALICFACVCDCDSV